MVYIRVLRLSGCAWLCPFCTRTILNHCAISFRLCQVALLHLLRSRRPPMPLACGGPQTPTGGHVEGSQRPQLLGGGCFFGGREQNSQSNAAENLMLDEASAPCRMPADAAPELNVVSQQWPAYCALLKALEGNPTVCATSPIFWGGVAGVSITWVLGRENGQNISKLLHQIKEHSNKNNDYIYI